MFSPNLSFLFLEAISIIIAESRLYLTVKNFFTVVLAVGIVVQATNVWVLMSFIIYLPYAVAGSIQVSYSGWLYQFAVASAGCNN